MLFSDSDMKNLLSQIKTIAVIGAKDKPGQPVDEVGRYLVQAGYGLYPVHPKRVEVWGIKAYAGLASLPATPDALVLFRSAEHCAGHAREVLALSGAPRLFWMQLGIVNYEAMRLMREAGIAAVQNACIMLEHRRLLGQGV